MRPRPRNWRWDIRTPGYAALLDACVLYPAPTRDLLVEIAATGLFRAKWTDLIHEEWISSLLRTRPDLTRTQLERTRDLLNGNTPDCLVVGYEDLISTVTCPDPNDRHVIAAAIKGECAAIVTFNLRHFPAEELQRFDIEAVHPDEFIHSQFGLDGARVAEAARRVRARLKKPPVSAEEYLRRLEAQSLPKTIAELRRYASVI